MKEVEELAGRLARVQGGKTVNKNTERMYGARRSAPRLDRDESSNGRLRGCSRGAWFL